jgi:hypothetical protein
MSVSGCLAGRILVFGTHMGVSGQLRVPAAQRPTSTEQEAG